MHGVIHYIGNIMCVLNVAYCLIYQMGLKQLCQRLVTTICDIRVRSPLMVELYIVYHSEHAG